MTYVYEQLTAGEICNALLTDEFARWSFDQAAALAEHLIQYAEETGQPLEFTRVGIRCEFGAYDSVIEAAQDWGQDIKDEAAALEYFNGNTTIIECADGSVIIQQF